MRGKFLVAKSPSLHRGFPNSSQRQSPCAALGIGRPIRGRQFAACRHEFGHQRFIFVRDLDPRDFDSGFLCCRFSRASVLRCGDVIGCFCGRFDMLCRCFDRLGNSRRGDFSGRGSFSDLFHDSGGFSVSGFFRSSRRCFSCRFANCFSNGRDVGHRFGLVCRRYFTYLSSSRRRIDGNQNFDFLHCPLNRLHRFIIGGGFNA